MICPKCLFENDSTHKFCGGCGTPLEEETQQPVELSEEVVETEQQDATEILPEDLERSTDETDPLPELVEDVDETEETDEALLQEVLPEETLPPAEIDLKVLSACGHVKGPVKDNDQDNCRTLIIDYPLHGFKVVIIIGADGIGGHVGGERWSHAAVSMLEAAIAIRMPTFDTQEKFTDRKDFGEALVNKAQKYFYPMIDWTTKCVYQFGVQEVGDKTFFGCTLVVAMMICDLKTGAVTMYDYSVGDSSLFIVDHSRIEKISTDFVSKDGRLQRYVGKGLSADGALNDRVFQLSLESLPKIQVLLCSDGLTNMLSPEAIKDISWGAKNSHHAVKSLIKSGLNVKVPHGQTEDNEMEPGDDNIMVAHVEFTVTEKK